MKIIHFSKNRPMQYRAFLESFLYNTNPQWGFKAQFGTDKPDRLGPITCILSGIDGYEDIVKEFTGVNFIDDQGKFFDQILRDEINNTYSSYILFGCDDQIFCRTIDLKLSESYLDNNPDCLGFSLRLGTNLPALYSSDECVQSSDEKFIKWQWPYAKGDFSVPFELMGTVYPKWVCQMIIDLQKDNIKCPNFYESFGCNVCHMVDAGLAQCMACENTHGSTFAQDVNRVQNYFENKTQGNGDYSPETLIKLYKEGYRLDWKSMQNIVPNSIFMGDKYWKLIK